MIRGEFNLKVSKPIYNYWHNIHYPSQFIIESDRKTKGKEKLDINNLDQFPLL